MASGVRTTRRVRLKLAASVFNAGLMRKHCEYWGSGVKVVKLYGKS